MKILKRLKDLVENLLMRLPSHRRKQIADATRGYLQTLIENSLMKAEEGLDSKAKEKLRETLPSDILAERLAGGFDLATDIGFKAARQRASEEVDRVIKEVTDGEQ